MMAGNPSQQDRIGELTTPLGENVFVLSRFEGGESLSEPFEFRNEAISEQQDIDFSAALGKSVTVKMKTVDGKDRYFNGLLAEASWSGQRVSLFVYQLVVRPWFFTIVAGAIGLGDVYQGFARLAAGERLLSLIGVEGQEGGPNERL
jgi:type VI secretion system secreted protein VgrG